MYQKLVALQQQLQADQQQLQAEVEALQTILDEPEPPAFDEYAAASRITAAKTKDHLEGTKNAAQVIKSVNQEREATTRNFKKIADRKAEARQQTTQKSAQLASVNDEITALGWKIKAIVDEEAKRRLSDQIHTYRKAASMLLNALVEIDALNAVMTTNPHESPTKFVLHVESLPAIGPQDSEVPTPWQLQASGEKFIFTRESAFQAVQNRQLAIIDEIKGALDGKK